MTPLYVEAVGLLGPGLPGWPASRPVLAGARPYVAEPFALPPNGLLPANERRRAPLTVKIALAVGAEIFAPARDPRANIPVRDPRDIVAVFAASGGDGETIQNILATLATPPRELSPTRFHNSVHNAAAGYWSIATGATAPATSLCAHDGSFAAGLLEAAGHVAAGRPAALIAYDVPNPEPLHAVRPIAAPFGVSLLLTPERTEASLARLGVACGTAPAFAPPLPDGLETLRRDVPAARALPLLAALARGADENIAIEYLPDLSLRIALEPLAA